MIKNIRQKDYEVIVVGGGMSGICAAIASARHGAKTALIHNRPVLGGNASSEIRMHICGADHHGTRPNARETGILEEILLENRRRNPNHSFSIFDTVLWEKVRYQEGLDLYLNTHMTDVELEGKKITSIKAEQLTTEKVFNFTGKIFVDTTGDATLSYLTGAEIMTGRESKACFGEKLAPDNSDNCTMGSTLMFKAIDTKKPVSFIKPDWANTYTEEDLNFRDHSQLTSGYWWVELGGDDLDTITDNEELRDKLLKAVYGVWDHIKNTGNHHAENMDLDWIGFLPGKRESRRVVGDYILKEQDLLEGRIFEDAVAYGGWPMDMHAVGGLKNNGEPTDFIKLKEVYTIPYRCLYSKDILNLMIGGRAISASHMAFGSTRIMATCAVVGQAIGTACSIAIHKNINPPEIMSYITDLQQTLLRDDCYIPGFKNTDESDLARSAEITVSSSIPGGEGSNVINGFPRKIKDSLNCWVSDEIGNDGEWINLHFKKLVNVKEINIKFDSNLSNEIMISLSDEVKNRQVPCIPPELVKDYKIEFYHYEECVHTEEITENYQRFRIHKFPKELEISSVKISVSSTNGDKHARIFEIRIY